MHQTWNNCYVFTIAVLLENEVFHQIDSNDYGDYIFWGVPPSAVTLEVKGWSVGSVPDTTPPTPQAGATGHPYACGCIDLSLN